MNLFIAYLVCMLLEGVYVWYPNKAMPHKTWVSAASNHSLLPLCEYSLVTNMTYDHVLMVQSQST